MNSRTVFVTRMLFHITEFEMEKIFLARLNALGKEDPLCPLKQNKDDGQSKHQSLNADSWITLLSIHGQAGEGMQLQNSLCIQMPGRSSMNNSSVFTAPLIKQPSKSRF
jgi:hypothetical protein